MTRFRIEFEGRAPASRAEVDAALELVRERLAALWIAEPSASAEVTAIEVHVSFVLDAEDTHEALEGGHALLGHVTADAGLSEVAWTAARAEISDPNA